MKPGVIFFLVFICPAVANGQYFQYSQHNFTDQRVNPAMVAASDYATAGFIFRNQATAGDIYLKSSMASVAYPFLTRREGRRWSGLGLSLMDDRSGGIFTVQEASLTYAINVYLDRFQSLSLGFKGLYMQRRVNLSGLYTGSQYIQDRGFDESLFNGENFGLLRSDFTTFSAGLHWQQTDRHGRRIAWWGLSFFDMNKPQDSFSGIDNKLPSTFVASGGIRIHDRDNISLTPGFLFTRSSARNVVNIGLTTSYEMKQYPNRIAGRVDLLTNYIPGRSGIVGVQIHRDDFSLGFSYDFPLLNRNPANTGAFEVGLQLRRLVDPALKKKALAARRKKSNQLSEAVEKEVAVKGMDKKRQDQAAKDVMKADSVVNTKGAASDLRTSLREKTDSVMANARVGRPSHEPFIIEKLTLHFNFEFNRTNLDAASIKYLDDVSAALKENLHMKVKLTGHTDNIGSAAFNMRLSMYRAEVVMQYLLKKGIERSRIETEGKGLTEPLNGNATDEERALNRRVELLIYYQE